MLVNVLERGEAAQVRRDAFDTICRISKTIPAYRLGVMNRAYWDSMDRCFGKEHGADPSGDRLSGNRALP